MRKKEPFVLNWRKDLARLRKKPKIGRTSMKMKYMLMPLIWMT
jgi:hypothetical protein